MPVGPLSLNDEVAHRSRLEDPAGDQEGPRRQRRRSRAGEAARGDGRQGAALRPQERQGLLRLSRARAEERCGRALAKIAGKRARSRYDLGAGPEGPAPRSRSRWKRRAAWRRGVVTDPREADVGSILGFGFAPFTGGAISLIDGIGAKAFVARAEELAAKYGPRFAPSAGLRAMAAKGESFYGAAAGRKAA